MCLPSQHRLPAVGQTLAGLHRRRPHVAEDPLPKPQYRLRVLRHPGSIDARVALALQPHGMLKPAQFPVRCMRAPGEIVGQKAERGGEFQQRKIADVGRQPGVLVRVTQHQVLHHELDIDDAAAIVLEIEQPAVIRVRLAHLVAHRQDLAAERRKLAGPAQYFDADALESSADSRIARDEAGAGQRLMFPHPGLFELILPERSDLAHQESGCAVGTQSQIGFVEHAGGSGAGQPGVDALCQARVRFRRGLVIVVVQENDVEIGRIAKLLAAQFAVADDRKLRLFAVTHAQRIPGEPQHSFQHGAGEVAQVIGQRLERQRAGEVEREQAQRLRLLEVAQEVHLPLGVALVLVEARAQGGAQLRPVRRIAGALRVDQFIEQHRMLRQVIGGPWTCRSQARQPRGRIRIFEQQGEIGFAPADAVHDVEHALESRIRIGQHARGIQHLRNQPIQQPLAGCRHAAIARTTPEVDEPRVNALRIAKAHAGEARERVFPGQRLRPEIGLILRAAVVPYPGENRFEVPRHDGTVRIQLLPQVGVIRAPHHLGDHGAIGVRARQHLRLLVVQVLQTVFEIAQIHVGGAQFIDGLRRQNVSRPKQRQRLQRRAHPEHRFAAAADDLEHLHQELDFPDAARAELDVVRDFALLHFLADLRMQAAQAGDGAVVEMAAVNKRREHGIEVRAGLPGDRPRFHPGIALPFASLGDEVLLQHVETHREWPTVAIRPQPRIDAEHEPVRRDLGYGADDPAREPDKKLVVGNAPRPVGFAVLGIGEHDIDVRRHVEFAAAQLAHRDHVQLLRLSRGYAQWIAKLVRQPSRVAGGGRGHGFLRQRGDGVDHLRQVGAAIEIARDQSQHDRLAQAAQRSLERAVVVVPALDPRAHPGAIERRIQRNVVRQFRFRAQQVASVARQPRGAGDCRWQVFRQEGGGGGHAWLV